MVQSVARDVFHILRDTQRRYVSDAGDAFAAAIGFFGFLSLAPLVMLGVALAGFLLDDPARQAELVTFVLEQIPGFAEVMGTDGETTVVGQLIAQVVAQRGRTGLIGVGLLLLSGLRVVAAASAATRVVFRGDVESALRRRLRQLVALAVLGVLTLLSAAGAALLAVDAELAPAEIGITLTLALTFLLDVTVFLGAYVLLAPHAPLSVWRRVPGALAAGVGWTVLKVAGTNLASGQIARASVLYGALGSVVALMLLFYLAGRLYVYGAAISAVLADRVNAANHPLDQ